MVLMFGARDSLKDLKKSILTNSPVDTGGISKRMEDPEKAELFTKATCDTIINQIKRPARIKIINPAIIKIIIEAGSFLNICPILLKIFLLNIPVSAIRLKFGKRP